MLNVEPANVAIVEYVDYLLLSCMERSILDNTEKLALHIKVSKLGECSHVRDINIESQKSCPVLSHIACTNRILEATIMTSCKPSKTTLSVVHSLYELRTNIEHIQ